MLNQRSKFSRLCVHCGGEFILHWGTSPQKFCSRKCRWKHCPQTQEQVFWSQVDKSGNCWLWTGSTTDKGYPRFKFQTRTVPAHRFALSLRLGRELLSTEIACHGCDNPTCVRVGDGHIFLG